MPGPRHKCKPSHRWELKLVQFQEKVLKEMSNISRSLSLIVESRKIEYETIRKSANSINVITRFLAVRIIIINYVTLRNRCFAYNNSVAIVS